MATERAEPLAKGTGTDSVMSATNPATGQVIGSVPMTPVDRVPGMYARARRAQGPWGALTVRERTQRLQALRRVVARRLDEVAARVARNTGKTEAEVLIGEGLLVLSALEYVETYAHRVLRRRRRKTPVVLAGKTSWVEYMPKGVVLVIAPWNFPLQLALVPVIYALAAGNAVILKPSEATPDVGLLIEELVAEARLPEHVLQLAHGAGELGAALVTPPQGRGPDHIFFTGSVPTGKIIQRAAAEHLIPTTLELSGKDALIVFADAPMERAVNGAVWGAFMNCGQVCVAPERLYVERGVHDEFVRLFQEETARLRQSGVESFGPGGTAGGGADVGSMTFAPQVDIVKAQVRDALEKGAALVHGSGPERWRDMFIPPVVLAGVTDDMRIAREETFGPVVTVHPFDTEDDAVRMANDSPFGLNASVWTKDKEKGRRVASRLEAGGVAINDVIVTLANQHLPFGGMKQSGIGANHGETGLKSFVHEKAVMADWLGRKRDLHWFPYEGKGPLFSRLLRGWYGARRDLIGFFSAFLGLSRRSR